MSKARSKPNTGQPTTHPIWLGFARTALNGLIAGLSYEIAVVIWEHYTK